MKAEQFKELENIYGPFSGRSIYCFFFENGRVYVGQTKNLRTRLSCYTNKSVKKQYKIYNAIQKYGFNNLNVVILATGLSKDQANELEIQYIKKFDSIRCGYNISLGGNHSPSESEEAKQKLRNYNALPETKARKSEEMRVRMQDPEFKAHALSATKTPEAIAKHTEHFRKLIVDPDFLAKKLAGEPARLAKLRMPENRRKMREKAYNEIKNGKSNLKGGTPRPIQCVETKEIFKSIKAAAEKYGGSSKNSAKHLWAHLHGVKWRKKFKGLHFKFLGDKHDHR